MSQVWSYEPRAYTFIGIWLLYCIQEHREEKGVALQTYRKPRVEEEGHAPVMSHASDISLLCTQESFYTLQLRHIKY
jgi:hypothetical protein